MPDEKKEEEKKDQVDFKTALDTIEKRVTEKLSEGIERMAARFEKPEGEEKDENWLDGDEEFISKKDLPQVVDKIAAKVSETTDAKLQEDRKKQQRDAQAMNDFPELNAQHPAFNRKFYDEVSREIDERVKRGRSAKDLDLIYDSAAAIAARGQREGWYVPKTRAEMERKAANAREDSFSVSGKRDVSGTQPTDEQMKLAEKWGMTKEKFSQHFGKISKR